jgi:hypothetical protein
MANAVMSAPEMIRANAPVVRIVARRIWGVDADGVWLALAKNATARASASGASTEIAAQAYPICPARLSV